MHIYIYIYIYIYVCAVESKAGPRFAFLKVKKWSRFLVFLVCFKDLLLSAGRMILFKTRTKKKSNLTSFFYHKLVQLCCATYLDQFLTYAWTSFWLVKFDKFGRLLNNMLYCVFSNKNAVLSPPKKSGTLFVNIAVLTEKHFWVFFFCPVFFAFFERHEKKQKQQDLKRKRQ